MNASRFYSFHASESTGDATETQSETLIPTGGTISSLYVTKPDPGVGNSYILTARYDEGNSSPTLTCTISSGQTSCNDTSNSYTVAATHSIALGLTNGGTPVTSVGQWGVKFTATTAGEFIIAASNSGNLTTGAAAYNPVDSDDIAWNATETSVDQEGQAMSILNIYTELSAAPGAGTSYQFDFRQNANNSSPQLTCTVSGGAATTCNTATTVTVANADLLATLETPTGPPTARAANISYTGFNSEGGTTQQQYYLMSKETPCATGLAALSCP